MPTSELSGPARRLLTVQALYILAGALAGIFVNIFLWQTRTLRAVTIYNLFYFTAIPVFFIVGGALAKAYRRSWGFTLGALLHSLFYSLLLVWATEAGDHLGFLGTLAGAATGFSWINLHTLAYDLVSREQRDRFFGLNGMFNTVSTLVGPLVAGFVIFRLGSPGGYRFVFGAAVAVFLVETVLSLGLRSAGGESLRLRTAFSLHAAPGWERALAAHFVAGARDGVLMTVGPILIYALGANTLDFGRFNSLFALLTTGAYFLGVRLLRPGNRGTFLALGSWGSFAAALAIAVVSGLPGIMVFNVLNAIFPVFYNLPYLAQYFDLMQTVPHAAERRVELIISREIWLDFGRVVSAAAFLLTGSSLTGPALRLVLPLATAPLLLLPWLMSPASTRRAERTADA